MLHGAGAGATHFECCGTGPSEFHVTTQHRLGGGGFQIPPPPKHNWAKLCSALSANQKFSLAPSAPISLDQKFSSAPLPPLTTQHHRGGGGGLDPPPHPPRTPLPPTPPPLSGTLMPTHRPSSGDTRQQWHPQLTVWVIFVWVIGAILLEVLCEARAHAASQSRQQDCLIAQGGGSPEPPPPPAAFEGPNSFGFFLRAAC